MTAHGRREIVIDLAARAPAWTLPEGAAATLRAETPPDWRLHLVSAATISDGDGADQPSAEALAAIASAEAYVGFGVPRALLQASPLLRWVHTAAAGVGGMLHPELLERGIALTNSAGVHAPPMAEYAVAGILHFLRVLDVAVRQQADHRWDRERFVGPEHTARELSECRALIVGTGGVGSAVARALAAFGARCTGLRRRPELGAPEGFDRVAGPEALDVELPGAELLILAAPLTDSTGALIDGRRLDLLPATAVVVNIARGRLLDEVALAERLRAGTLRGAVLDVFEQEPLAEDSPLWGLDRVLLTPHVSAVSPRRFWERQVALIVDNWRRYRSGEPLRNLVDPKAGY